MAAGLSGAAVVLFAGVLYWARESMMGSGLWGVPTMRMGEFVVWGQDRDWLLVRHLEELCDPGDGIIV